MTHRIIINSAAATPAAGQTEHNISTAESTIAFSPSHHITVDAQMRRLAKAQKKLDVILKELTAPPESDESVD